MPAKDIATRIYNHPDREEIIAKLLTDTSPKDISDGISARYSDLDTKQFQLSERMVKDFKNSYLDFYSIMKKDLIAIKTSQEPSVALTESLNTNLAYKDALSKYANQELDIKTAILKLTAAAEHRVSQVFDNLQGDVENLRNDRILIEWVATLRDLLKECNEIVNGSPDQIAVQNNISIQVLDTHMDTVFQIIREILSGLDYESSLKFVDLYHDQIQKLKEARPIQEQIPVADRLVQVQALKLPE